MRWWRVPVTTGVAAMALALAPAARADFTETFCTGGTPPAPWINGVDGTSSFQSLADGCLTSPSIGEQFVDAPPVAMASGSITAAGFMMPTDEELTGLSMAFHSQDTSNGTDATLDFRADSQVFFSPQIGDDHAGTSVSVQLPDVTELGAQVICADSSTCEFAGGAVVTIGAMSVTIHDTGTPAAAPTGGSLAANGATLKGTQTLLYHATDAGSGVDTVALSLGSTPLAVNQSPCQSASLTPCPATVNGSFSVNTAAVPDGTYPVILTATDASGDPTPVQVATVTIDNATGTTTVKTAAHGHHAIHTRVTFKWDPRATTTRLIWTRFGRLPRHARVTLRCSGDGCPFHRLRATARRIRTLERRLRGRTFHAGDRLTLTISAPHRRAETGVIRIRHDKLPTTR